ncbi:signal peptidase I [Nocardioides sp. TRM66260-LWL]|uniref:signal peptidase I n=1 Tax=Nocardioides sp. TRM66260-LWL TaxID=2874478 RepID=UPI001CC47176|nr:signal peptidase I [Nocardioides sp. TRM66260-LWL]MBZ5733169.1 signal peptidase I [Nocardioides sp. TRM66260-LWL]
MTSNDHDPQTDVEGSPSSDASEAPDEAGAPARPSLEDATARPQKRKGLPVWQESILLLVIAVGLAVVLKAFFVQAFYIPSESMEPGLVKNDRILVQKVSYWTGSPQRGDVIVFKDPGDWLTAAEQAGPTSLLGRALTKIGLYPAGGHLVKRVIGVPGDTIHCCDKQGRLQINGKSVDEQGYARVSPGSCYGPMISDCSTNAWTAGPVPPGHVFVMGDNRQNSADSTVHLCQKGETDCVPGDEYVPDDLIVGKVFVLLWPLDRFTFVGRPDSLADVPAGK